MKLTMDSMEHMILGDGSEFKGYLVIFCFQEQRGGDCS